MPVSAANKLPFKYTIKRSLRAKNTRLVVKTDSIEVVAPKQVSKALIEQFVHARQDWVLAAQKRLQASQPKVEKLTPSHYKSGAKIPFLGRQWPLTVKQSGAKTDIQFNPKSGFVVCVPTQNVNNLHERVRSIFLQWLYQQAGIYAQQYIVKHAPYRGLNPRNVHIKTMKSRWGSCGIHNDLNLNVWLMLAPEPVFEYVVVHELCHIKHRNHSPLFWSLVAEHLPEYQQHREWLKLHGHSVMLGV